jgi:hypothetical protein
MSTKEDVRPSCTNFELIDSTKVYILGNGSLFLIGKHRSIHKFEEYCIDQIFSLACLSGGDDCVPENMSRIELTKCCGPNQIYSLNNVTTSPCTTINTASPLFGRALLDNVSVEMTYKFPECASNEFAIAGTFSSENYQPKSGDVKTESGKVFNSNQYCLDHVQSERYECVKIFTCSELSHA